MGSESGFPTGMGSADTADADGRRGSNHDVYEVNSWLWLFASGKPRLVGLSVTVEETALKKLEKAGREEQVKRASHGAVGTRRRRKAWPGRLRHH